ncbi:hypothetical protein Dsin_027060 [Dipteronia sinensis]|uniref:Uncharacterized protein n=1 Tax=Dipteronia sinensis TaxID=43782 RepID=A0AAE0DYE8_9ROSI|nr:hypothetical protein Dsin_027060 [Dipteronia sinensis]
MMMLDENTSRVALTTDIWTSNRKKGYKVVTAHFIDSTWKLRSRILRIFELCNDLVSEYQAKENGGLGEGIGFVPEDEILRGEVMDEDDDE